MLPRWCWPRYLPSRLDRDRSGWNYYTCRAFVAHQCRAPTAARRQAPISSAQISGSKTLLFARSFYSLQANELLFSVQEKDFPVLYVGDVAGQALTPLGISGQSAVGSKASQRIVRRLS